MSERGVDFLWDWLDNNVTSPDRHRTPEKAKELAAHCIADADDLGITIDDMELPEGSIEAVINETMRKDPEELVPGFAPERWRSLGI